MRYSTQEDAMKSYPCSNTSTLSSGYGSEYYDIDQLQLELRHDSCSASEDSVYFDLECDDYVTIEDDTTYCMRRVQRSMENIVSDLKVLGFDASLECLEDAVKSSLRTTEQTVPDESDYYVRLIEDISSECKNPIYNSDSDPIYEEIGDYAEFDHVTHSETSRRSEAPALPPRTYPQRPKVTPQPPAKPQSNFARNASVQSLPMHLAEDRTAYKPAGLAWRSLSHREVCV